MSAPRRGKAPVDSGPVTVSWSLAELPSAQHRAGLAGLVLMVEWLNHNRGDAKWTCRLDRVDAAGCVLTVDQEGMSALFDATYAAELVEHEAKAPRKDKNKHVVEPKRIDEVPIVDGKGKTKVEKRFIYEDVVPRGGLLASSPYDNAAWIKLWRDMVWGVLRGVPATRGAYEARAAQAPSADASAALEQLRDGERAVDLPSTYYLGAQAINAEQVSFRDRGRFQFLLHFWPFATPIYVPATFDHDGNRSFVGYALAVPDVANLALYCSEYKGVLRDREPALSGYRPRAAIVDLAEEAGLDTLRRVSDALSAAEKQKAATEDLVLAIEVIHVEKEGNNIRIRGVARVEPVRGVIDAYRRVRDAYWSAPFRTIRVGNVVARRPDWWAGFDRLIETTPQKLTIGSEYFRRDAKHAFNGGEIMANDDADDDKIEVLVYRAVGQYVSHKLKSKYDLDWKGAKGDDDKSKDYGDKRRKVALDAFLAVRARDRESFKTWFAETLCSAPQRAYVKADSAEEYARTSEARFQKLARAVLDRPDEVRTLTLLALSAQS